ncbi:spermatogenic leucine zipper protein 1 [Acomys russatus]|uniref:spermatogenic leucine zipper protein 1 n=1 Tax=Acomys russatus TaxID=60746 RepID=UPI0021E25408|nr:spermatogenic leucine zipper protein 1 [Acomys russatus]
MANSDSSAEKPAPSQTPNPTPGTKQGPPNPGITISLLEIGSLPPLCWGSLPTTKNSFRRRVGRPGTVQKFSNLLKDVREVLKSIANVEEKTVGGRESFDDARTSEDVPELKIRGVRKRNKMRFKDEFYHLDPEGEQNAKEEVILKNQSAKNLVQALARDLCDLEEKNFDGMPLRVGRGRCGPRHFRGEHRKLRNNMEQLLQEADHWSRQHSELSDLMRSYQECHEERQEALEDNRPYVQTQPNNELSAKQELEAQVKKLSHDTHSLHLVAALLQNECQILQQRVDILNEFQLHETEPLYERPLQILCELDRKGLKSAEADGTEASKQTVRAVEGMSPRKEKIFRNSDACLSKKARNNRFNTRIARKTVIGKRRTASIR